MTVSCRDANWNFLNSTVNEVSVTLLLTVNEYGNINDTLPEEGEVKSIQASLSLGGIKKLNRVSASKGSLIGIVTPLAVLSKTRCKGAATGVMPVKSMVKVPVDDNDTLKEWTRTWLPVSRVA